MKVTPPVIICAALGLAGCATTSPGPAAATAAATPLDLTPWLGYYYAGTIGYFGPGARQIWVVIDITKKPNGGYLVHRCGSYTSDYFATTPEPDMTCYPAASGTQHGAVLRYIGGGGSTVRLTFSSPNSIRFHSLQQGRWVWTGTLDRTNPVPATKS